MNGLNILLWLEFRKHWRWLVVLMSLLILWFVWMHSLTAPDQLAFTDDKNFSQNFSYSGSLSNLLQNIFRTPEGADFAKRSLMTILGVGIFGGLGLLVFTYLGLGLTRETRAGQFQFLLLSPPSGYIHVLARFLFLFGASTIFFVILIVGTWIGSHQSPLAFDGLNNFGWLVALYFIVFQVAPLIASLLFMDVTISTYRLRGSTLLAWLVFIFGSMVMGESFYHLLKSVSYKYMPAITIPVDLQIDNVPQIPTEPLAVCVILTALMLLVAGRIWDEVEV